MDDFITQIKSTSDDVLSQLKSTSVDDVLSHINTFSEQAISLSKNVAVASQDVSKEILDSAVTITQDVSTKTVHSYEQYAPVISNALSNTATTLSETGKQVGDVYVKARTVVDPLAKQGLNQLSEQLETVSSGVSTGVRDLEVTVLGSDTYTSQAAEGLNYSYNTVSNAWNTFSSEQQKLYGQSWQKAERRYQHYFYEEIQIPNGDSYSQLKPFPESWEEFDKRLEPAKSTLQQMLNGEFAEAAEPFSFWGSHVLILAALLLFIWPRRLTMSDSSSQYWFDVSGKIGTCLMETPGMLIPMLLTWNYHTRYGIETLPLGNALLLGFLVVNFLHRGVYYPFFRLRRTTVPAGVVFIGFFMSLWVTFQQALSILYVIDVSDPWANPPFCIGLFIASIGCLYQSTIEERLIQIHQEDNYTLPQRRIYSGEGFRIASVEERDVQDLDPNTNEAVGEKRTEYKVKENETCSVLLAEAKKSGAYSDTVTSSKRENTTANTTARVGRNRLDTPVRTKKSKPRTSASAAGGGEGGDDVNSPVVAGRRNSLSPKNSGIIATPRNRLSAALKSDLSKVGGSPVLPQQEGQQQQRRRSSMTGTRQVKRLLLPVGGICDWVVAPQLFFLLVQWAGFALAANLSLAHVTYLFYETCNYCLRAQEHFDFYKKRLGGIYPGRRKAVIPLLF